MLTSPPALARMSAPLGRPHPFSAAHVTPDEIDLAISELETRLERLRALYEQYFMGIERMEPAVVRKDVDRRFYVLRKEKIRNTAKRFKLQTLVQRYNTMQQYWSRICREIELGTYKRHKLKAERAFGSLDAAAQRSDALAQPDGKAPSTDAADTVNDRAARATRAAEDDLRDLLASDFDPSAEVDAAMDALFSPKPTPAKESAPKRGGLLSQLGSARTPASGGTGAPSSAVPGTAPSPTRPTPSAPSPSTSPATSSRPVPSTLPSAARSSGTAASSPAPSAPASGGAPPSAPPTRSKPPVRSGPPGPPPRPSGPPTPVASRPPLPPPRSLPAPAHTAPPAARPAAKPAAAAATKAASGGGASGLDDARLRELHQRYQAAREQTKSGGPVSLEKLAQNLRETEAKLRAQHQGKRVDFDVVVKDGKAVIKPKLS